MKNSPSLGWVYIILGVLLSTLIAVVIITDPQEPDVVEPTPTTTVEVISTTQESIEVTVPTVNKPVDTVPNFNEDEEFYDEVQDPTFTGYPENIYTDEELEILAIIIYQEAGADFCSDDTRRKVGSVFLNRVNSHLFPDTFSEVALQDRQYGTLCYTGIKWPDRATEDQEAHAVERAYAIAKELLMGGSILPDNVIWQAEFVQGDGIYCYQDEIYFCYSEVTK